MTMTNVVYISTHTRVLCIWHPTVVSAYGSCLKYPSYQEEWRAIAATASTADDNRVHNWRRRTGALECSLSELKRKYSPVGLEQGAFCHKKLQLLCFNDNSFINITLEIFENNQWLIQLQYKDTMNCPEKVVKISHFN